MARLKLLEPMRHRGNFIAMTSGCTRCRSRPPRHGEEKAPKASPASRGISPFPDISQAAGRPPVASERYVGATPSIRPGVRPLAGIPAWYQDMEPANTQECDHGHALARVANARSGIAPRITVGSRRDQHRLREAEHRSTRGPARSSTRAIAVDSTAPPRRIRADLASNPPEPLARPHGAIRVPWHRN